MANAQAVEKSEPSFNVTVMDAEPVVTRNAASARIDASGWVDYLHLAKWNGRWVIVNVLWELHPRKGP